MQGKISHFAPFGAGVTSYFKFLKYCCWSFFVVSCAIIPHLLINTNGRSITATTNTNRVSWTTMRNLGSSIKVTEVTVEQVAHGVPPASSALTTSRYTARGVFSDISCLAGKSCKMPTVISVPNKNKRFSPLCRYRPHFPTLLHTPTSTNRTANQSADIVATYVGISKHSYVNIFIIFRFSCMALRAGLAFATYRGFPTALLNRWSCRSATRSSTAPAKWTRARRARTTATSTPAS